MISILAFKLNKVYILNKSRNFYKKWKFIKPQIPDKKSYR